MLHDILFSLWFLLPVAIANVVPIFGAAAPLLSRLDAPIDGGRTWHGHALLGSHKTWRGLVIGLLASTLVLWLQQLAVAHYGWAHTLASGINYAALPLWLLGPLFGLGALGGGVVESFFKRQIGVKPGGSWIPFDQLDYIIGGVVVSLPFVILSFWQYFWIFVVWFGMHLLASYGGWLVGLKDQPI
jgi:CDP-2,3-bis-(O-geranylgeranyl)-sn-glycerol synthase